MMSFLLLFLYNILIFCVVVVYFPFHCVRILFFSKYRSSTLPRLGFQMVPSFRKGDKVYWFHSVSVGETKAIEQLVAKVKQEEPQSRVVISTITQTGQDEAKKIQGVDSTFYYPVDFFFLIYPLVKRIKPSVLMIVETDLWLNLLQICSRFGTKIYLVNAKLSERSASRYKRFPLFLNLMISPFKHFFSQAPTYTKRFLDIGVEAKKISTLGNLKFNRKVNFSTEEQKLQRLENYGLSCKKKPLVVFASTHQAEEEIAVRLFRHCSIRLVLVPRHPERFKRVKRYLQGQLDSYNCYSDFIAEPLSKNDFFLLDTLGELMNFYEVCDLAIVAGSFNRRVGGHNIFEPAFYKKPFIYGPYLYNQPAFLQLAKDFDAGKQCQEAELIDGVNRLISSKKEREQLGLRGYKAIKSSENIVEKVYKFIKG